MMHLAQQKEQFSGAYLRAVATVAGYALYKPEVDDDSIDWGLAARGAEGTPRRPRLELQLKCSARDILHETHLHFPLEIKNYNDLRAPEVMVPRILVVVLVPALAACRRELPDGLSPTFRCSFRSAVASFPRRKSGVLRPSPRKGAFLEVLASL